MKRLWLALAGVLALAGCEARAPDAPEAPQDAASAPALWEVTGPGGARGWLFGTIHALPDGARWRTPALEQAIADADVLVVEIADLADAAAGARAFAEVSTTPGLPPLLARVPAADRDELAAALRRAGLDDASLAATESWAAALLIANAGRNADTANGVDRALLESGLPVVALESFARQFAIFDRLAEDDQAVLLREAAVEEVDVAERRQLTAWTRGDLAALEREMSTGLLADPELREALLTGRNRAWAERIDALLQQGRQPLVAVGAGHMVGVDGLPALLAAQGHAVRRVQ